MVGDGGGGEGPSEVDGVEVQLPPDQHGDGVRVRVTDSTHDLNVVPGFTPPPTG